MNEFHTDNKPVVKPPLAAQTGGLKTEVDGKGKPTLKDVLFAKDPKQVQAEKKETN